MTLHAHGLPHASVGTRSLLGLGVSVALVAMVATTGALINSGEITGWYLGAQKPPATPPNWVFGPVWTVLYLSMAVAAWLVWRRSGWAHARTALMLYLGQLLLNWAWTPIFFAGQALAAGLLVVVALDVTVLATALRFRRHHRLAAGLLLPYLAWCLYATYLNAGILLLNR